MIMTEEEQNELLTAALELAGTVSKHVHCHDTAALVAAIEKHRPAPKLAEGWMNLYDDGPGGVYQSAGDAKACINSQRRNHRMVHMREVVDKEWKPWHAESQNIFCGEAYLMTVQSVNAAWQISEAHNKEMEALAKL